MKRIGKVLFTIGLVLILVGTILIKKDSIITFVNSYTQPNTRVKIDYKNKYYRNYDFIFVQNSEIIEPKNYQDLLNIYYTVINSGDSEFTFYCPKNYEKCNVDMEVIAKDQTLLSDINNYVHPYNAFSHIETEFDTAGKITITIQRAYTNEDTYKINEKVNEIYKSIYNKDLDIKTNIKNIHDYIINNTKYDTLRSDENIIKYRSDMAYGPLFEGYAVCGGYTDLMQLFLEKMNLKSYRVSSTEHIWNAVEINNKWYHIDLTWDDPISEEKDYLDDSYLLIDTNKLFSLEKEQHNFDQSIFLELKETN